MVVLGEGVVSYERGTPVGPPRDQDRARVGIRVRMGPPQDQGGTEFQWLQRHPEAGSSWPSWPEAS